MYCPNWVRPTDDDSWKQLVQRHPLASLVSQGPDGPVATHLPFLFDPAGRLVSHMALGNRQWRQMAEDPRVLVLFQSPSSYVSPAWYQDEPDVPTWNYAAAHVRGRYVAVGEARRDEILGLTVERFSADGWGLDRLEPALIAELARGVTAFEIEIISVETAFKLSQDKTANDRTQVIGALESGGDPEAAAVAAMMRSTCTRR